MKESPRLILPDPAFAAGYLAALAEGFSDTADPARAIDPAVIAADLPAHLRRLNRQGGTETAAGGTTVLRPPSAHFWLVAGADFIGRVSMRYALNAALRHSGGHVGYAIRPARRRQGMGHAALALAKAHAAQRGLTRLLLTCDDGNAASARIIEAGGGVLEGIGPHPDRPGHLLRRYWITLPA